MHQLDWCGHSLWFFLSLWIWMGKIRQILAHEPNLSFQFSWVIIFFFLQCTWWIQSLCILSEFRYYSLNLDTSLVWNSCLFYMVLDTGSIVLLIILSSLLTPLVHRLYEISDCSLNEVNTNQLCQWGMSLNKLTWSLMKLKKRCYVLIVFPLSNSKTDI